jgi:ATP phosphoribosyltransferase regulatory subunit
MKTQPAISLPQGVRDILPEESSRVGAVEGAILGVFERNGFERVITPMLEFMDVLELGLDKSLRERVVKFIDPATGRVVGIRPDITPQIARVVSTRMRERKRPLKLCYNESVLRYLELSGGKAKEIAQAGAELLTEKASAEADAEMVVMALEALKAVGLGKSRIDLGDVGFVHAVLDCLKITVAERRDVMAALAIKDNAALKKALDNLSSGIDVESKKLLLALTSFYGEEEVLEKAISMTADGCRARLALDNMKNVLQMVAEKGYKDSVTIDLGEVRGFDYYTGVIMEGFAGGFGKPLLSGGRYDNLLGNYGYPSASTGFAFDVESVIDALGRS